MSRNNNIATTLTFSTSSDKLFFGESGHGIARYDQVRYPQFLKIDERMKSLFWRPQEVDMSVEKASFEKMNEAEQFVFTQNLSRQIVLDSMQGRAPVLAFLPHCTDPALENCILTWSFFESIHSESYTHIIRSIYTNPSVVFDTIPQITPIVDCATSVTQAYDELQSNPNEETLYLALVAANALEALRFYVSFACTFSFAERGYVEGPAKVVKFIARDEHCLLPGTELLTSEGWVKIEDVTVNHRVAQMSQTSFEISFANPIKKIWKDYEGTMIRARRPNGSRVFDVTEDHDVLLATQSASTGNRFLRKKKASEVRLNAFVKIPVSGVKEGSRELTPYEALLIAIQADGGLSNRYTGSICGTVPVEISLTRGRKKNRLREILKCIPEVTYKETSGNRPGEVKFTVNVPITYNLDKNFDWVNLEEIDTSWARGFMDELVYWDGYKATDGEYWYYSNTNTRAIDKVQAILAFTGFKHRRGIQEDFRKDSYKDIHRIYWWPNEDKKTVYGTIPSQNLSKEEYQYEGKVGCVTMPEGTIVTRIDGNVTLSGNCHLALVQHIIKTLPKDDPIYLQVIADNRQKAKDIFNEAAEQERQWTKHLFQHGSILGLNEKILNQYVDYLLIKRKHAVDLTSTAKSRIDHPIPWVEKWYSNSSVQVAPQEVEVSSYLTGSVVNDISEADFSF